MLTPQDDLGNKSQVIEPPDFIDGARVIKWAWSGQHPFGYVSHEEVYGLAICQYEDNGSVYRFSCDKSWNTVQDSPQDTVEEAINELPDQCKNVKADWKTK